MKRRAQNAAQPPAVKKKKLLEDEIAVLPVSSVGHRDRVSRSKATTSIAHGIDIDEQSTSSSSSFSHSSTDNAGSRSCEEESSPTGSVRVGSTSNLKTNTTANYPTSSLLDPPGKPTRIAVSPSGTANWPSSLTSSLPSAPFSPTSPHVVVCWARVNRCSWWPGKVCNMSAHEDNFQICQIRSLGPIARRHHAILVLHLPILHNIPSSITPYIK